MLLLCVLGKNRSTRKAEYLQVLEEVNNVLVAISEVAAMTLVEDHHNLLVAHLLQMLIIVVACYCAIQFLDSCNDNFGVSFYVKS